MGHKKSTPAKTTEVKNQATDTSQNTVQNTQQQQTANSFAYNLPGFQETAAGLANNQINLPAQQRAGWNDAQNRAYSEMVNGNPQLNSVSQGYADLMNQTSTAGMNNLISSYMDNDAVKANYNQLKANLSEVYEGQVQGLNQRATATGNMGSSRAGVAQGVMAGQMDKNLSQGFNQIYNNAYTNATSLAQQQISNTGSILGVQRTNALQDIQNRFNAGTSLQTETQSQLNNDYQNQFNANNPYYVQAQYTWPLLSGVADFSKTGTTNTTGNTYTNQNSFTNMNANATQQKAQAGWQGILGTAVGGGIGGYFGDSGAKAGAAIGGLWGQQ